MKDLREKLQSIVDYYDNTIAEWEEETGREAEYGMMSLCLDSDDVPVSFGNADDVLNDGYNAGYSQGKQDLAEELLKMLDELEKS